MTVSTGSRNIKAVYYRGKDVMKVNKSKWANSASKNAFDHMQLDRYEATHCEVYDERTGELHAVLRRKLTKGEVEIETLFKREVKEGM